MKPQASSHTLYIGGILDGLERLFAAHDGPLALESLAAARAGGENRLLRFRLRAARAAINDRLAEVGRAVALRRAALRGDPLADSWLSRLSAEMRLCRLNLTSTD